MISIRDNDSLAARLASEVRADLLILMSDVDGIYTRPPKEEGARLINTYCPATVESIHYGEKSRVGLGGMDSKVFFSDLKDLMPSLFFLTKPSVFFWKVRSACWALDKGISVVICNGMAENAVRDIVAGRKLGTFFTDYRNGGTSVETAAEQGTDTWVHKKQTTQFLLARYITEMQCGSRDRSFVPLQKNPSKKKIH